MDSAHDKEKLLNLMVVNTKQTSSNLLMSMNYENNMEWSICRSIRTALLHKLKRREVMKIAKKIKLNGPVVSSSQAWIYDWLGMENISPARIINELEQANGEDVELYINSGGGSVFAASEIYTALKEYSGKITSKITGVAASAATFFIAASKYVYASPLAQVMIHNASLVTFGDKVNHSSSLELLQGVDKSIARAYQAKTKLSESEILDLMNKTTWMSADRAQELGFIDGILFDEEVQVSNSFAGELPQEVIDKLKDELMAKVAEDERIRNLSQMTEPINQVNNEGNDKVMNLEQLKAQHPDLYNQVINEGKELGATAERERITSLNALAKTPGASEIVAEAIQNGANAGDTAIKILEANAKRVETVATNRQEDADNSGVNEVNAEEAPGAQNKDTEATNLLVAAAKKLQGGN